MVKLERGLVHPRAVSVGEIEENKTAITSVGTGTHPVRMLSTFHHRDPPCTVTLKDRSDGTDATGDVGHGRGTQ